MPARGSIGSAMVRPRASSSTCSRSRRGSCTSTSMAGPGGSRRRPIAASSRGPRIAPAHPWPCPGLQSSRPPGCPTCSIRWPGLSPGLSSASSFRDTRRASSPPGIRHIMAAGSVSKTPATGHGKSRMRPRRRHHGSARGAGLAWRGLARPLQEQRIQHPDNRHEKLPAVGVKRLLMIPVNGGHGIILARL